MCAMNPLFNSIPYNASCHTRRINELNCITKKEKKWTLKCCTDWTCQGVEATLVRFDFAFVTDLIYFHIFFGCCCWIYGANALRPFSRTRFALNLCVWTDMAANRITTNEILVEMYAALHSALIHAAEKSKINKNENVAETCCSGMDDACVCLLYVVV